MMGYISLILTIGVIIVVSDQDVIDVLNTLDPNKDVGPDIIRNKMLIAVHL
jgi:hypothetical protein